MKHTGIFPHGNKFKAEIKVNRKTVYLGLHKSVQLAEQAQIDYRKQYGIPEPTKKVSVPISKLEKVMKILNEK